MVKNPIDIDKEQQSADQKCFNCNKPNAFGDLYCVDCYERINKSYEEEYKKVR